MTSSIRRLVLVLVGSAALVCASIAIGAGGGPRASAYGLTAICGDFVPDPSRYILRLRNTSDQDQPFTWFDRITGQRGSGTAPAETDTFFDVLDASRSHTVIVDIGDEELVKATNTVPCRGTLNLTKQVEGPGIEPPGAVYEVIVSGDSGFEAAANLAAGESRSFQVPGTIATRSAPIGEVPGGYTYTVSETDGFGANVTVAPDTFVFNATGNKTSTITNQFPTPPPPPPSADLALTKSVSPDRAKVGDVVTYSVEIENLGPDQADNVVGVDIPQRTEPNRVAEVVSIEASQGTCTARRPVTCEFGDVPAGGTVTLTAAVRPGITGLLQNLAEVDSDTPDPNRSNNQDTTGLFVDPDRSALELSKRVRPGIVEAGKSVRYTLKVRAEGPDTAVGVQVCDQLPKALRVESAPGGAVSRDRREACWVVRSLEPRAERKFTLRARTRALFTVPRSIRNTATAVAENAERRDADATIVLLPGSRPDPPVPPDCRVATARC